MIPSLIVASLLARTATGNLSTSSVETFASTTALEYGLNQDHFLATLKCESGFEYDAVGDDGISIGAVQINLKAHPDIFYSEAMDPRWSIVWMAQMWKAGYAHWWSCYNMKAWEYKKYEI